MLERTALSTWLGVAIDSTTRLGRSRRAPAAARDLAAVRAEMAGGRDRSAGRAAAGRAQRADDRPSPAANRACGVPVASLRPTGPAAARARRGSGHSRRIVPDLRDRP